MILARAIALVVLLAAASTAPCVTQAGSSWESPVALEPIEAIAVLHASKGSAIVGKVELKSAGDALMVRAELGGLVPGAEYHLQIHQYGDCSATLAKSAGEIFGSAQELVVFRAGDDGWADLAFTHRGHTLDRTSESVLGRSVVVHGRYDREGCGTIGIARRSESTPPPPASPD